MRLPTALSSRVSRLTAVVASTALVLGTVLVGAPAYAEEAPVPVAPAETIAEQTPAPEDAGSAEEAIPSQTDREEATDGLLGEATEPGEPGEPGEGGGPGDGGEPGDAATDDPIEATGADSAAESRVQMLGSFAPMDVAVPVVSVSKTSEVSRAGETVTVSGTGYDPAKVIYVAVCEDIELDAVTFDMFYGCKGARMVSASPTSSSQVQMAADGSFSFDFAIPADAAGFEQPAIFTIRNHMGPMDRSQDAKILFDFAAQVPGVSVSKT